MLYVRADFLHTMNSSWMGTEEIFEVTTPKFKLEQTHEKKRALKSKSVQCIANICKWIKSCVNFVFISKPRRLTSDKEICYQFEFKSLY